MLLEGELDAVDETFFQPLVHVGEAVLRADLLDNLHSQLSEVLVIVLEIVHDDGDDLSSSHLASNLDSGLNQVPSNLALHIVLPHPEPFEELGDDLLSNILSLNTSTVEALPHHLENCSFHIFITGFELIDEHLHHSLGVLLRKLWIHQRDDEPDGLHVCLCRMEPTLELLEAVPQRGQHFVKCLHSVWV